MGRNRHLKTMSKKDNIQNKVAVSPSRPLICSTAEVGRSDGCRKTIMNTQDDFQIFRDERTKLVNEIADLKTENAKLREAMSDAERQLFEMSRTLPEEIFHNRYTHAHFDLARNFLRQR